MAVRKARSSHVLLPSRLWLHRASLLVMLLLCIVLMIMSKTGNPAAVRLRAHIMDTVTPLLAVAASPMNVARDVGGWFSSVVHMHSENIALKNENIELLKWQAAAKDMQAENEALRKLMHVVPSRKHSYVTARLVSDLAGPYVHSALVEGGSSNGIAKDAAALSSSGLLGRVVDVGETSARVLLLNDINSRVPIIAERSREKSILVGNNTGLPTLAYLSGSSRIAPGERLITSGDGGMFPAGIPVGVVVAVEKGEVSVQPFADVADVEYISIVNYSF